MIKYALEASPEMDALIKRLAVKRGVEKEQVLRHAIVLMDYLMAETAAGKELLLRDPETTSATRILLHDEEDTIVP